MFNQLQKSFLFSIGKYAFAWEEKYNDHYYQAIGCYNVTKGEGGISLLLWKLKTIAIIPYIPEDFGDDLIPN